MQTVKDHQRNVFPACADAGSTLHVPKRKNVIEENAYVSE